MSIPPPFEGGYETAHYLSTTEAAEHLGITRQAFHHRTPPKPQVLIGNTPGWTPEVLEAWDRHYLAHKQKPGRKPAQDTGHHADSSG